MIIGFACGVFDLFHAGHVLMFMDCKKHCDYLIVAVNQAKQFSPQINPGKEKPVFSFEERKLILESCRYVDEVLGYFTEEELLQIMKSRNIDIRFIGEDYRNKPITGSDLDLRVVYINRDHGFSTSEIKNKIRSN